MFGLDKNMFFDKEGNPCSVEFWNEHFQDFEYKRIAKDEYGTVGIVSTVWLGMNHAWGDGPPLIFETMVFGVPKWEDYQDRYSTLAEAQEGHKRVVAAIYSGLTADEFWDLPNND